MKKSCFRVQNIREWGQTYDDNTSLICSISRTVGTVFAMALPSIDTRTQLLNVSTEMTAAKFTDKQNKKKRRERKKHMKQSMISKWINLEFG